MKETASTNIKQLRTIESGFRDEYDEAYQVIDAAGLGISVAPPEVLEKIKQLLCESNGNKEAVEELLKAEGQQFKKWVSDVIRVMRYPESLKKKVLL